MSSDGDSQESGYEKLVAERGDLSAVATQRLGEVLRSELGGGTVDRDLFEALAGPLSDWSDEEAAAVLDVLTMRLQNGLPLSISALVSWISLHRDDARGVRDCLMTDPPDGVTIISVLSRAGSQKVVFLANWHDAQREIVLKKPIGTASERLIARELQPHPLSMVHPNIIETHLLHNEAGEPFLGERRLTHVLSDDWLSHGADEAANLLHDMASALQYLHLTSLIHGDVKPDNIGYEDRRYLLLDFGICRPVADFAEDSTPTGSLRTRAPELLLGEAGHSTASDIWALGATVFNSVVGRFPLFDHEERPPRVSSPGTRLEYEQQLAQRAANEWDRRVATGLGKIDHDGLRSLLANALSRDPASRSNADTLVMDCRSQLAAFIRRPDKGLQLSPTDELEQLRRYLTNPATLNLMPQRRRTELNVRLKGFVAQSDISEQDLGPLAVLLDPDN
jgi:serine/threonine protein kinase